MQTPIERLVVSSSPHFKSEVTIQSAMRDVVTALLPALFLSVYFYGWNAVGVVAVCILSAVISEAACQKVMGRPITVDDASAVLTGLLLAFCLPPGLPLWMAAVGGASAIILGKQVFGGLGQNIFNPALVGRAILLASWPVAMTSWISPLDGTSTATPLGIMKEANMLGAAGSLDGTAQAVQQMPSLMEMFIGSIGGSIGETSVLALVLGGIYLCYKGHIDWRIPSSFIGSVFILTSGIAVFSGLGLAYPLYHLFGGGLMLGAFFMATDWVTSPITKRGKLIMGLGCGLITVLIRVKGGYPEGVCYSILLMNCCTPLIDRYSKARVYGRRVKNA